MHSNIQSVGSIQNIQNFNISVGSNEKASNQCGAAGEPDSGDS